jgi:NADP-dependent 3-hydroxy acid dehydrogenase YdfG
LSGVLEGRTAFVTGASRGVGAAIARELAGSGARVGLAARTRSSLDQLASDIGNGAFPVECDVSNPASVDNAVAETRRMIGGAPDILINNAGLFTIRGITETSLEEFQSLLSTNVTGAFSFIRAFLPEMISRGSGHVVTIGSVADRHIFPGNAAYSATKYASRAIHEVLRAETRGTGVRATLVSPAAVDTDIWDPIQYFGSNELPDRSGMLSAESVGQAVLFAVSRPANVNIDELRLSKA